MGKLEIGLEKHLGTDVRQTLRGLALFAREPAGPKTGPAIFGMAFLVPVIWVFRRASLPLTVRLTELLPPAALVTLLACGFAASAAALVASARCQRTRACLSPAVGVALACLSLLAMGLAAAPVEAAGAMRGALAGCSYFLLGACLGTLFYGWACVYARLHGARPLLVVSASVLLGNIPRGLLMLADGAIAQYVVLGCCLFASCACLFGSEQALRGDPQIKRPDPQRPGEPVRETLAGSVNESTLGLALCCYAWGVMAIPPQRYTLDRGIWVFVLGNLLECAVVAAFATSLSAQASRRDIRQRAFFLLPLFAVLMAFFAFARMLDAQGPLRACLSVGYNAAISGFAAMFFSMVALRCRERIVPVAGQVAGPFLLFALIYLGGALAYATLGNASMYVLVSLVMVYLLALNLTMARRAVLRDDELLQRRCASLTSTCGLSEREAEVLGLLADGYSTEGMAEKLGISPGTVGTHRKHIYAKVGAHSRDELMRAIREQQA